MSTGPTEHAAPATVDGRERIASLEADVQALAADNASLTRRVAELERQLRLVLGGLDALRRASLMVIDPLSKALGLPKRNN